MRHKDTIITYYINVRMDGWSSVLRPRQHSIGYMGDGFYRSKDPTNSINVRPIITTCGANAEGKWGGG